MKIITVWTAHMTVDEYGRLGELIGVFLTEHKAKKAAEGRGWWGSMGTVTERAALLVPTDEDHIMKVYLIDQEYDTVIPLDVKLPDRKKNLKKIALSKLSLEEREILGIKEEE